MSSGIGREIGPSSVPPARKITLEYSNINQQQFGKKLLLLHEGGRDQELSVRTTRRGIFVGCTFVSYDALDELVRISNEDK